MEELIQLDKQLLLMVNGSDSLFLDYLVMTLTNAKTWIPLYIALFYVVLKANNTVRDILLVLAAAGLCVLLAGTVDDMLVKPTVARWRPGHDPEIGLLVDTVDGYRGGKYGFFSAHASNTFSIALFFSLLMRRRLLVLTMLAYSLLNCWTRLYLGVHYPGDITVGLLWGALVG
ncbi:MAG: phosphatase PAP2 family protein, partial [Prevotella sp.]|nr:phosphatase PAP2 family protein [Prevotella sp.]